MITSLFPNEVKVSQCDPAHINGEIHPQEKRLIEKALPKRRREFTAGRLLARGLLAEFGITNFPLLKGKNREPLWPAGFCGSITHTKDYCAVVLAKKEDIESLGIDGERTDKVDRKTWHLFCTEEELACLYSLPPTIQQDYAALIYSAKESLYKCLYPLKKIWIDFKDVSISMDSRLFSFEAAFNSAKGGLIQKGTTVTGKYVFNGPYVTTGITLYAHGDVSDDGHAPMDLLHC